MLVSTLDLLTQAASNSLYVFCFCNLIIVMIVVGSKPGSYFDQESELPRSLVTGRNDKKVDHDSKREQKGISSSSVVIRSEVSYAKKELASDEKARIEEQKGVSSSSVVIRSEVSYAKTELASDEKAGFGEQNVDSKECDNNDELRRRAEEFIEKVNRGWRAELLRTSHFNQGLKSLHFESVATWY